MGVSLWLQLLLEEVINSNSLSPEVSGLVEMLWTEALGRLEDTLLRPVGMISLNDVSAVSWKQVLPGKPAFCLWLRGLCLV